ncbi:unnamed protein product [Sphenostylis stenocarpa]|uniref:Uncharacterized protein n=1 Tax=Sphenostylis stenocarpa TaxID=92480 RepID=A0AA86VYW8_9FABA|nr:unnamed protein product [Sphenostylis stenocarpa]
MVAYAPTTWGGIAGVMELCARDKLLDRIIAKGHYPGCVAVHIVPPNHLGYFGRPDIHNRASVMVNNTKIGFDLIPTQHQMLITLID